MVFRYYETTDMLYIQFVDKVSVESEEVAPNIVLDIDENKEVVGIEIEDASDDSQTKVLGLLRSFNRYTIVLVYLLWPWLCSLVYLPLRLSG
jgi:uncharacterized protein YuzE